MKFVKSVMLLSFFTSESSITAEIDHSVHVVFVILSHATLTKLGVGWLLINLLYEHLSPALI